MPVLETVDGAAVDVAAVDTEAVNREFSRAMASAGPESEQAPPKRTPKANGSTEEPIAKPKRTRPPKAEQARTTASAGTVLDDGQRAQGVKGLAQLGAGVALMLGKATKKDAYTADAVAIASAADQIADACVQTAHADAKFAAALDRVCSAGPYAALITVGAGLVSQIARNHKPGLSIPGTIDPAELLSAQQEAEKVNA